MAKQCAEFQFDGERSTISLRWANYIELFRYTVDANGWSDAKRIKASLLLGMGRDALDIYRTKKKADDSDTAEEIIVFMTDYFEPKKSEYVEIDKFRRAVRRPE